MNTELKSHLSKNIEFKAFLEKKTPFYSEIIRFISVNDVLHTPTTEPHEHNCEFLA